MCDTYMIHLFLPNHSLLEVVNLTSCYWLAFKLMIGEVPTLLHTSMHLVPCRYDRFKANWGLNYIDVDGVKALLDTVGKRDRGPWAGWAAPPGHAASALPLNHQTGAVAKL
jgi:hypothetical protein